MNNTEKDKFTQCIQQATEHLRTKNCDNAYDSIIEAMQIYPNAPHPHNLLGIFYELTGDEHLARRHYRAAYSLDPTYKPACRNLERLCADFDNKPKSYDFGDMLEEADRHFSIKRH